MPRRIVACVVVVFLVSGCNKRVFVPVQTSCDRTIPVDVTIPTQKDADILIVVDNSGSMQEEQDELARNFLNLDTDAQGNAECPLTDLANIPERLRNPTPDKYTGDGELAKCGFIQLLAAFENDFRVGVITTDVGLIDNRQPEAQAARCFPDGSCAFGDDTCSAPQDLCEDEWGQHPQRGCLQPDGAGNKIINRADIDDAQKKDLAARFAQTLGNIRTFGSPVERGLDAAAIFLDADAVRGAGCEDDLTTFRRPDAQLAVIFLTDEEDCSHGVGDPAFPEELAAELESGTPATNVYGVSGDCYERVADLSPVAAYRRAIEDVDPQAKVALIAGMVASVDAPDGFDAVGCVLEGAAPSERCWESHGQSNSNLGDAPCGPTPSSAEARAGRDCTTQDGVTTCALDCCVADPGSRYVDFARLFVDEGKKRYFLDSICNESFKETMLEVAAFIAATNAIDLVEPPVDGLISVVLNDAPVPRIDASSCDDSDGWYLEGDRRIVFCGAAIPGPEDELKVRAKAASNSEECQAAL